MNEKKLDWENAEKWLKEVRQMYVDCGSAGMLSLRITIDPLLVRFERGERTKKLYSEIMSLK